MPQRSAPTVVVARSPVAGREREFERWLRRLTDAAAEAPGYRHADIQRPDGVHPGEWVIVYGFDSAESLERWMRSPERSELLVTGAELVDGEAREQVVALAHAPDPVTAVASFRVRPGHESEHAALLDRLQRCLAAAPGFLRSEVFEPVPGVQDDTVVVFSFDTREHLDAWLVSDERLGVLAEIGRHVEGERTVNVIGGFAGWFGDGDGPEVKRWKQASVVLLALFPTALVLSVLREWLLPDLHWTLGVLFGNVLGIIVLTWVLMPWLTRLLASWLRR